MSESDHENRREKYGPYWEKACEDSKQRLVSYALRLSNGRPYDADDLVQETIFRVLFYSRNPEAIRDPVGYLLKTMHNVWIGKWRKENAANIDSLDSSKALQQRPPAVETVGQRTLENNELRDELGVREGPLTPREKLLLRLYFASYKCKEISVILNEDVRLIRSDLNAVKAKVRYRLKRRKKNTSGTARP
jgi:RNA polymerase sigma factor (sigma-70 family)